eukprot:gnl/MRDRNA2_/MRDRNA2_300149_c0_seq1.p1 gnl/MRDRNA2_/MRDRNA2_300149_c0~~gnl/MRDRNA2_/MRDRNA2_300149_c0_seq1.p1  ORF type:complete len:272 (+),score=57.10 gnl/MRDRNA2_/MRDRNA2_300149_c0_seq1:40-816(+)
MVHQGRGWKFALDGLEFGWFRSLKALVPVLIIIFIGISLFNVVIAVFIKGYDEASNLRHPLRRTFVRAICSHMRIEVLNWMRQESAEILHFRLLTGPKAQKFLDRSGQLALSGELAAAVAARDSLQLGSLATATELSNAGMEESHLKILTFMHGQSAAVREKFWEQSAGIHGNHLAKVVSKIVFPRFKSLEMQVDAQNKLLMQQALRLEEQQNLLREIANHLSFHEQGLQQRVASSLAQSDESTEHTEKKDAVRMRSL